jgi:hypothetical protein
VRSIGLLLRAEWRRRWPSWLALALLVAVIGGTVLSGASAARRTVSALPQFVNRYGYNAEVFGEIPFPKDFATLPHIDFVSESTYIFNGNARANAMEIPAGDVNLLSLPTHDSTRTIRLLSGHLPLGPRQVLVGYSLQQRYDLHVGSIVTVPLYRLSQTKEVENSTGETIPTPHGPRIHFRVAGVEASLLDFPSASPSYAIYTSAAFNRGEGRHVATGYFAEVRLHDAAKNIANFQLLINNFGHRGKYFVYDTTESSTSAIEGSIHPQVVGWWFFALFAALAGLALAGQALARQSLSERASLPILSALGLRRRQLFGVGMVRAAVIGVLGALGALVTAYLLSPFTPVGEARAAETTRGFVLDGHLVELGAPLILLIVLLLAVIPSWRATNMWRSNDRREQPLEHGGSRIAVMLRGINVAPSVLLGVRNALERGRGRTSVPVATALIGTVLAVGALVASSVFGSSLSTLLATPRLYGANWQVDLEDVPTATTHTLLKVLERTPAVTDVTYGSQGKFIDVDGVSVQALYVDVAKGSMVYTLASGHHPTRDDQIDLGQSILSAAHVSDGSRVSVSIIGLQGGRRTSTLRVVGTVVIPPSVGLGGLGGGAVLTIPGIERLACGTGAGARSCVSEINEKLSSGNSWTVLVKVASDTGGRAAVSSLQRRYADYVNLTTLPTNLVNFGQAVDFPLLLSVTLAVFGAATLAHLLFVSVGRRRRQFALVKVLGFTRRQVRSAMYWQAVTVALVGVIFGVPLGIVIGKLIWRDFATSAGAVPVAVVPGWSVLYLGVAIVAAAIAMATIPAVLGSRIQPAEALRETSATMAPVVLLRGAPEG